MGWGWMRLGTCELSRAKGQLIQWDLQPTLPSIFPVATDPSFLHSVSLHILNPSGVLQGKSSFFNLCTRVPAVSGLLKAWSSSNLLYYPCSWGDTLNALQVIFVVQINEKFWFYSGIPGCYWDFHLPGTVLTILAPSAQQEHKKELVFPCGLWLVNKRVRELSGAGT